MSDFDMSRRRLLAASAFGLGAAALSGLSAACGVASGPAPAATIDPNVRPLELGKDLPGIQYPEGYVGPRASVKAPFADGSKTFRIVVTQSPSDVGDWNENVYTKWLEQRTGLKVHFEAILTSDVNGIDLTKVNAMMAAGDLPDAFMGIPFSDDQVSLYGEQGTFLALDDYIRVYAPEFRRMMADYPTLRRISAANDGRLYQLNGINDCYHCRSVGSRLFVNRRYLEAVGAAVPETLEEFRVVARLMKDQDPSPGRNIIPIGAIDAYPLETFFLNSFTYNPGSPWLRLDGEQVVFVADRPEWREGLRYLNSLFRDGTISRSAFTMSQTELITAGNQGRLGFVRGNYWGAFMDMTGDKWHDYIPVPPLEGPAGVRLSQWNSYGFRDGSMQITSACSNPELLVQWADHQLELEATITGSSGVKDAEWSWAGAGDTGLDGKQAIYRRPMWPAPPGRSWFLPPIAYRSHDYRNAEYVDPASQTFEKPLYEAAKLCEPYAAPKAMQLPPLVFDEGATAIKADVEVAVIGHVKQSIAKFVTGELDIDDDASWNAYVQRFQAMGLQRYIEVVQAALAKRPA